MSIPDELEMPGLVPTGTPPPRDFDKLPHPPAPTEE